MGYRLEGRMLEACSCDVICPCWVGEDPDGGSCEGAAFWHVDRGVVDGIDVAGLTIGVAAHIPGNATEAGVWKALVLLDDEATPEQEAALVGVWTGEAGGPVADLAQVIGEVLELRRVPISFEVSAGEGSFRAGDVVELDMEALEGATGRVGLTDSAFASIPGAPTHVGRSKTLRLSEPEHGFDFTFSGQSALQGPFLYEHA